MNRAEVVSQLLRRTAGTAPGMLVADVATAVAEAGGDHLALYVVDYEQRQLVPVGPGFGATQPDGDTLAVDGTMAGRAFQTQEVLTAETEDGWRVWAPLLERAERIGVLEIGFPAVDEETVALCGDLGHLVGHLIGTADRYTDTVEVRRRRKDMSLAAEIQWDLLLPPLAFRCPDLDVAGRLEPAYEVAGDAFDYAVNGGILSFAFLDAMGHGMHSALASALVLSTYRHGRRRGEPIEDVAHRIDRVLAGQFDGQVFVTGQLGELELATGEIRFINAGHPDPLLARDHKVVSHLHAEPCRPFGLGSRVQDIGTARLEPGDQLLFYSDGVVEARAGTDVSAQWGLGRLGARYERHLADGLTAAEILRRIIVEVCEHRAGPLDDDASLLLLQWRRGAG